MVSTASVTGRALHRHEIEKDQLERELAAEEVRTRAEIDRKHSDAREAAASPPRSGGRAPIRAPSDDEHIKTRVDAIGRLHEKHNARRSALRGKHVKELEAARKMPTTAAKHVPQSAPEKFEPHYEMWRDLDSARRQAVHGVYERYARLRDNADADHFSQARTASRYMQPGSRVTNDAHDRMEQAHLDLARKEFRELEGLVARFKADIESERRRFEDQARERQAVAARHASDNRNRAA